MNKDGIFSLRKVEDKEASSGLSCSMDRRVSFTASVAEQMNAQRDRTSLSFSSFARSLSGSVLRSSPEMVFVNSRIRNSIASNCSAGDEEYECIAAA